jgi:hypothetical protein
MDAGVVDVGLVAGWCGRCWLSVCLLLVLDVLWGRYGLAFSVVEGAYL